MRGSRCPGPRLSQSSGVKASTERIFGTGVSVARIGNKATDWTFRGSNLRIFLFSETSGVALEPTQPPMGTRVLRW